MTMYKVKPEYIPEWYGNNSYDDEPITMDEIKRLSAAWNIDINELLEELEELEENGSIIILK